MDTQPETDKRKVFLSYARTDLVICDRIKTVLEQAGIPCWRDAENIEPGAKWLASLPSALAQACAMVVIWTPAAATSDYMEREFHQAEQLHLRIIPVIVQSREVPFHLKDRNVIFLENAWDDGVQRLVLCFTGASTQRQAELDWLATLEQQLHSLYTPLAGTGRQSPKKTVTLPKTLIQQGILEHLAQRVAKALPEQITEYEDIQTAFNNVPRAVLLGEPGAGKTTTLHKLATDCLATAKQSADAPLPLLVSLGKWTNSSLTLDNFLKQQLATLGDYLTDLSASGRCILLLDGLNEMPSSTRPDQAQQLKRWLNTDKHKQLVCYISCRDLDYQISGIQLDLDTIRIRPLDPLRIRAFIRDYWPVLTGNTDPNAADTLFWALGGGETLRQTWLAWQRAGADEQLFWFSAEIPREQPDVYSQTNDKHDEIWRLAVHDPRSLYQLAANPFMLVMLLVIYYQNEALPTNKTLLFNEFVKSLLERERLEAQREPLLTGLQRLAWAMQAQQADTEQQAVQTTLSRDQALAFLDAEKLLCCARANLLDSGDDIRFSHQLLQEYFTALMMADKLNHGQLDASQFWPKDRFWQASGWEEATILLAGLYPEDCSPVLRWLLPVQPEMLARCIKATGLPFNNMLLSELKAHWQPLWLDYKQMPQPEARASIGRAFAMLGLDDRPGVGLNEQGLPDIAWVEVPPGKVTLEGIDKPFSIDEGFYLARYPISNAQFQAFVQAEDGFDHPQWWTGLAERYEAPKPPRWSEANHPRETVSWYEAMAFCAWLSAKLGYTITLPIEMQWQLAAGGGKLENIYPWGKTYQSGYANIDETWENAGPHDLQRTTAVGLYPQGQSQQGIFDLSGNVWEWCLNKYQDPADSSPAGDDSRSLRGGSWLLNLVSARVGYRHNRLPDYCNDLIGLRVCCASPIGH